MTDGLPRRLLALALALAACSGGSFGDRRNGTGAIRGRAVSAGLPAAGVRVFVYPWDDTGAGVGFSPLAETRSGGDGVFLLAEVPSGPVALAMNDGKGGVYWRETILVLPGGVGDLGDLSLGDVLQFSRILERWGAGFDFLASVAPGEIFHGVHGLPPGFLPAGELRHVALWEHPGYSVAYGLRADSEDGAFERLWSLDESGLGGDGWVAVERLPAAVDSPDGGRALRLEAGRLVWHSRVGPGGEALPSAIDPVSRDPRALGLWSNRMIGVRVLADWIEGSALFVLGEQPARTADPEGRRLLRHSLFRVDLDDPRTGPDPCACATFSCDCVQAREVPLLPGSDGGAAGAPDYRLRFALHDAQRLVYGLEPWCGAGACSAEEEADPATFPVAAIDLATLERVVLAEARMPFVAGTQEPSLPGPFPAGGAALDPDTAAVFLVVGNAARDQTCLARVDLAAGGLTVLASVHSTSRDGYFRGLSGGGGQGIFLESAQPIFSAPRWWRVDPRTLTLAPLPRTLGTSIDGLSTVCDPGDDCTPSGGLEGPLAIRSVVSGGLWSLLFSQAGDLLSARVRPFSGGLSSQRGPCAVDQLLVSPDGAYEAWPCHLDVEPSSPIKLFLDTTDHVDAAFAQRTFAPGDHTEALFDHHGNLIYLALDPFSARRQLFVVRLP